MENIDRISCLHDSILSHILSFLPIEEAVGTSVLSSRWRYLFSLLPNIDFELDELELRQKNLNCWWTDTNAESFRSFVDRMLSLDNTTKLDKFRLEGRMKFDSNRIYRWISAAVQRGIKHLDLSISFHGEDTTLPELLFTCRKLTTLKLKIYKFDLYVPKGVYFPNLKTLHLESVVFLDFDLVRSLFSTCTSLEDMVLSPHQEGHSRIPPKIFNLPGCSTLVTLKLDFNFVLDVPKGVRFPKLQTLHLSVRFSNEDAVTNLLSGCHNLEDMVIMRCWMENEINFNISHHLLKRLTVIGSCLRGWLMIDTPNLAYIKFSTLTIKMRHSFNLPFLVKADIKNTNIEDADIEDLDFQANPMALFLRGMCNVRSLILSATSLQHLLRSKPLLVFATLVELEIHYDFHDSEFFCFRCPYNHWEKGLETLLTSCSELENLVIYQEILCLLPENPSLLSKLKVIEISNFKDNKYCIRKAKYILNNGAALEKLKICTASYGEYPSYEERAKKLANISNALLASPRKSEQCCISII